jgi:transcriptional regulator with XRE-family HTH domain
MRRRNGLSQEDLAHASGLHPTYLSGIERGTRNPTWRILGQVSQALDVRISELAALSEELDGAT